MINKLLAVKIVRHDFGNNNGVSSMGFFPGFKFRHNKASYILRQGDVYKLMVEDKTDYYVVKFIQKNGYFIHPTLVLMNNLNYSDDGILNTKIGFDLFDRAKEMEYIGNVIEDDIPTILNIISNTTEKYLNMRFFDTVLKEIPNHFYNMFDKSVQNLLFHLKFDNAVFMLKDFEKIILENNDIIKKLDLRKVKLFPIFPFYNLYDFGNNKMPIHTSLNGLIDVDGDKFLSLLDNYGYLRIYHQEKQLTLQKIQLMDIVKNHIIINKITIETNSNIKNICFSTSSPEYIYSIQDINFEEVDKLIKKFTI